MKILLKLAVLALSVPCLAQLYSGSNYLPITGDPATGVQVMDRISVDENSGQGQSTFTVTISLALSDMDGQFLRPNSSQMAFAPASEIGPSAIAYLDPPVPDFHRVRLVSYFWRIENPANRLSAGLIKDYYPGQSSILIGFTRFYNGGWQYGWVHMEREVTRIEDMLVGAGSVVRDFAFRPKGFAIHPIPGRPIRAGMEPDLPSLTTELVTLEGGGGQGVRVSWPSGWPGMMLEYTSDLTQPTEWLPVAGVEGSEAVVELPEDGQVFFRLRYVP